MDKASLIEWTHSWRKRLVQDVCNTPGDKDRVEEISRDVQRRLCGGIISQMLADRNIISRLKSGLQPEVGFDSGTSSIELGSLNEQIQQELAEMDLGEAPFEVLSDVYESYLARKLIPNSAGELEYSPESQHRKGKGIYYTPEYVVRHIVDRTLGKYLRGAEDIRHLRILDPACGSGCFLAYAFDVLAEFYTSHDTHAGFRWLSFILENHLYGVDTDSDAVDITSAILTLKALECAGAAPTEIPKPNIKLGNFLVPNSHPGFSDWEAGMSDILDDGGFTMILGNPPYGARLTQAERKAIKSDYETYRSSDSSSLFIEKAVKALQDDGILGFIVPKSLSYVVSWQPIRKFLLDECRIAEIADARKAFKGVLLEQMVIIAQKRGKPNIPTVVSILRPDHSVVSHRIDRSDLSPERFSIWFSDRRIRDIVDRIWEKSVPLGHVAEIWNGLNIQGQLTFLDKPDSEHDTPCLRGKNIQRYHIRPDIQYVKMTDVVKHHHGSLEPFRRPRIIVQDIVAHIYNPRPHIKLTATMDKSALNVNTLTNIASSQYHPEYLCGILNSRLISWYAYDFIYNRCIRTMHFRRGYADHIPIPRMDAVGHRAYKQLTEHVKRMIALHNEGAAESEIAAMDKEINQLIYQLYDVTEEEISFLREYAGLYA